MSEESSSDAGRTTALLRVAQAFATLSAALLLFVLLWSRFIQIPMLERWGVPPTAIPALLWLAAAWQCRRVEPLTPDWSRNSSAFLAAAALQVYLLPYLGWWRAVTPELYHHVNLGLLILSCAAGLLLAHRLTVNVASCLGDRVLRIEAHLSLACVPLIAALLFGLLFWSVRRMGGELSLREGFDLIRASPSFSRASMALMVFMPLLPLAALGWETSNRIHAWLPRRRCPDDEA
ncbi:MAG TPA: hypothetical protein PKE12_01995 [Kiritimatiellia bacterium]|nr:hypothetical protein [Kiritimatiellia bacterium]